MTTLRPTLDIAARAAIAARTEAVFRAAGALREGHVRLPDGRHAGTWLETLAVLSRPAAASELVGFWAGRYRDPDGAATVDAVAGRPLCGALLAFEAGRQLRVPALLAAHAAAPGRRVLVVDDVAVTGAALRSLVDALEAGGAAVVGCEVLVAGADAGAALDSPGTGRVHALRALWPLDRPTFEPGPGACPRCDAGEPLEAPAGGGG